MLVNKLGYSLRISPSLQRGPIHWCSLKFLCLLFSLRVVCVFSRKDGTREGDGSALVFCTK